MAPKVHHFSCGTMCPYGGKLFGGTGGIASTTEFCCHVLLVETGDSLVLVDTGFGTGDVSNPKRLSGVFRALVRPRPNYAETAFSRVEELGFEPKDVGHIVATHLDLDHAGGLGDFPDAQVHVFAAELDAATHPKLAEKQRYVAAQWAHGPNWVSHGTGGDDWFGFESARAIEGLEDQIVIVPVIGHTRGHSAIAVREGEGWTLHCGDAYFNAGEMLIPPQLPAGLKVFQRLNDADTKARTANQERLRELARDHAAEVRLINSHDPAYLSAQPV
jgi:glyoxylase-like metal-dependent hydrolase (beta-lactamase superfamily II)